jgi:branched-chain amino acid transport system ATP-binding protein
MIRVTDLHKHFGGVHAVDGASIEIKTGTITGLIGPNGAGKTTLFNVIAGAFPPTAGKVELDGEDITGLPAHELFHKGLLRTFQIAHEFSTLTVRDNLMMVPPNQPGESLLGAWFKPTAVRKARRKSATRSMMFWNSSTSPIWSMNAPATCPAVRKSCSNLVAP